ncbi:hypothetical protein [Lysobacter sp. Root983]|uniref:metalloprotease n=1 Tax=Lysobacter sp. Root983 TaxID=1736613 RepID=UPI00070C1860|nr:hypothetical protein [Lysobacter sp. Root983]KRD79590.1 hypothetical protein ASE43_01390 [Lysobacter sp. Root983]
MRPLPREFVPFRLLGAPVVFHWSVLVVVALILSLSFRSNPLTAAVGVLAYLLLIVAHEAGHAWVARRHGLYVESLRIYPMHGGCVHESARTPAQDIAIAWGGVGAQALLFGLAMLIGALPSSTGMLASLQTAVVIAWGPVNLMILVLNLLPVPPLDGARAWRVLPWMRQRWRMRAQAKPVKPKPRASGERGQVVSLDEHRKRKPRSDD